MEFASEEINFIVKNECCRLATCFRDKPHVIPVSYIFLDNCFYISTDYKTKKLKNIKNNPYVSLVVDIYSPPNHKGIVVDGRVELIENGELFNIIFEKFFKSFEWVRKNPWTEGEAPFLKIYPYSKISWGLKK